jgi:hypothetical protein
MDVTDQPHAAPAGLPSGKIADIQRTGRLVGPTGGPDLCMSEKYMKRI